MNAPVPAPTAGASPALAAFLRGVGRRVLLFADVQAGAAGRDAVAAVIPGFLAEAAKLPMARWPQRFWARVLALPALHADSPPGRATGLPRALTDLGPGPRVAVLLWLVAGLEQDEAAAALGVEPATWQLALQRAAPRDADGRLDEAAWRSWSAAVGEALRQVPAERLAWWEQQCAAGLQPVWHAPASTPRARPAWVLPLLWTGVGACVLALAATFWWLPGDAADGAGAEPPPAHLPGTPLPAPAQPAATYDAALALRSHRDLGLLAGGDEALLRDLDFRAWHAARLGADASADAGEYVEPAEPAPQVLQQRLAQWQALSATERALLRERWDAWQQLPASERAAVIDAATTFDALAPAAQQELRLAFAALPDGERRGWLLGPRLGNAWPRLQPLLMQVPAAQREPLLAVLHSLSPLQLDDLATLAQRTPPQDRDGLRRELLSTAEANRTAWLRERLRR